MQSWSGSGGLGNGGVVLERTTEQLQLILLRREVRNGRRLDRLLRFRVIIGGSHVSILLDANNLIQNGPILRELAQESLIHLNIAIARIPSFQEYQPSPNDVLSDAKVAMELPPKSLIRVSIPGPSRTMSRSRMSRGSWS